MAALIYKYFQKDNDQTGVDILRLEDKNIPKGFLSTIKHTSRESTGGNNINQTVEVVVPVLRVVDSLTVSTDSYKATLKFSALQHITNDAERYQAFDSLIAYAAKHREAICTGRKPLAAEDLSVTTSVPV